MSKAFQKTSFERFKNQEIVAKPIHGYASLKNRHRFLNSRKTNVLIRRELSIIQRTGHLFKLSFPIFGIYFQVVISIIFSLKIPATLM